MPPSPGDDDLLDRSLLRQLAGEEGFARGERIFGAGRVHSLRAGPDRATARVSGSARFYRVKLWRGRGELHSACTCPLGRDGGFCKHCVAVGLAWLQESDARKGEDPASETHPAHSHPVPASAGDEPPDAGPGEPRREMPVAPAELRAYVNALDKRRLAELVLEAIDYDEILRRRLMLETTGAPSGRRLDTEDLETYRQLLREAIETGEYVDYDAMPDYVQGIEEAVQPLHTLLDAGQPGPVIELCELALVELDRAADLLDTSDGSLNGVYDELQRLHLEACGLARPDPISLASRLLHYELEGGLGVFNNAAAAYAEVLGPRGLAAYRQILAEEWNRLPPLRPAKIAGAGKTPRPAAAEAEGEDELPPIDYRRFQLSALMERLAANTGADADTLAAIRARDLSSPQDFLAIARLYEDAGNPDQAISWAEKGLTAFPRADHDSADGLRDFLANLLARRGRREDALTLVWAQFLGQPTVERFARLKSLAEPEAWPRWREHALTHLRATAGPGSCPTLLEILLADGDLDGALAEARAASARVPADLWLVLAARLEPARPAEALEIYRRQLDDLLSRMEVHRVYRQADELLRVIRSLLARLGRKGEFAAVREELRTVHRHRRGFVKLLDSLERKPPVR